MRSSSLLQGIVVAFGFSVMARPLLLMFAVLSFRMDNQLLIASLTAAYILYIMSHRQGKVGRLTLAVLSCGLLFGACFMGASIGTVILLGVGLIWLVRSVLRYTSLLSALLDGLLNVVSLAGAAFVAMFTGSVALTVWGFFLCQALWVLIPAGFGRLAASQDVAAEGVAGRGADRFGRSYHAAEAAIRRLARQDV